MKVPKLLISAFALSVSCLIGTQAQAQICASPLTPAQRGYKVKFFPGHYVAVTSAWTAVQDTLTEISGNPNIVGIQKRYTWSNLQKGPNEFDFSKMKNDIDLVASQGKKMSIMILWKYKGIGGISPVPAYIKNLSSAPVDYLLGGAYSTSGWLAAFDNPTVSREFAKFLGQLALVIDNNNAVANVVFPETAMGVPKSSFDLAFKRTLSSSEATDVQNRFIDGVMRVDQQATCAFKHTPVVQLTNFPIPRLNDLTRSHKTWSVGMGGPDVWMNDDSIERSNPTLDMRAFDYYPLLEEALPIGVIIASGNYRYESHYPETISADRAEAYTFSSLYGWSPDRVTYELGNKAVNQLTANYIFWKRDHKDDPFYLSFKRQSLKIGTSEQTIAPVQTGCPTNYSRMCVRSL